MYVFGEPTLFFSSAIRPNHYVTVVFTFPVHFRLGFAGGPASQPYRATFHRRAARAFDVVLVQYVGRDSHVQVSVLETSIVQYCNIIMYVKSRCNKKNKKKNQAIWIVVIFTIKHEPV